MAAIPARRRDELALGMSGDPSAHILALIQQLPLPQRLGVIFHVTGREDLFSLIGITEEDAIAGQLSLENQGISLVQLKIALRPSRR